MENTVKYMTMEECRLYRELSVKQDAHMLGMSMALPCYQLEFKEKEPQARKLKKIKKKVCCQK